MPKRRLELPRCLHNMNLNHARLPVPPLGPVQHCPSMLKTSPFPVKGSFPPTAAPLGLFSGDRRRNERLPGQQQKGDFARAAQVPYTGKTISEVVDIG